MSLMPFFQNRRNLIILFAVLLVLPVLVSLLISKSGLLKNGLQIGNNNLGKKEVTIPIPSSSPSSFDISKTPLICPSSKEFCSSGKSIEQNGYIGFGAVLPPGNLIVAVFDGDITSLTAKLGGGQDSQEITTIHLDNKEKNLRATYIFNGRAPKPRQVKQGASIGIVGTKLNLFDSSLIFKLIKGNPINGEVIKLTSEDFVK